MFKLCCASCLSKLSFPCTLRTTYSAVDTAHGVGEKKRMRCEPAQSLLKCPNDYLYIEASIKFEVSKKTLHMFTELECKLHQWKLVVVFLPGNCSEPRRAKRLFMFIFVKTLVCQCICDVLSMEQTCLRTLYIPRKKELLPMAWKQLLQSS